ncbi:hypothetical protein D0869_08496 [Hortaea werneckii]|uniref:Uncharacterized protein n=1 Tax=Hortaea werneckii TaxID=91943 RepID=A0A3M6Z2D0_HORWE|nr:hypothetical protein D0869_08496 [Hortaea werneckii]RMY09239.1 hypothetical protein D0867_08776 [Hortaea werneckii]
MFRNCVLRVNCMDWTGGVRRRFAAGKNNALVQKQKAHFAKVRSRTQNTPKSHSTTKHDFTQTQQSGSPIRSTRDIPSLKRRVAAFPISAQDGQGRIQRPVESLSPMTVTSAANEPSSPAKQTHIGRTHSSRRSVATSSKEEQLLDSKRHQLLAQSDWLGLATVRPLQLEFPSAVDKDRIGKRRKIHKPTQCSRPAVQRLLTPLFEEAPAPQGAAMRATQPIDEMRIKVGTDAFESQTQRSRNSPKRASTSMRHPSVEFGPISEESMLLGDNYEDFQPRIPSGAATTMLDGSPIVSHATTAAWPQRHSDMNAHSKIDDRIGQEQLDEWLSQLESAPRESSEDSLPRTQDDNALNLFENFSLARTASQPSIEHPPTSIGDLGDSASGRKSDSESSGMLMRQLLEIQKYTSSNASISAVRSSSQHSLTSEVSHRPILDTQASLSAESAHVVSTPCGVGTQDPDYTWHDSRESPGESSTAQSPSDWHSERDVAQVPGQALLAETIDTGSEGLYKDSWRDFIIGSVDGGSQLSDRPNDLEADELNNLQQFNEVFATSSIPVSGMGSSDMATGGSSFLAGRHTPDRNPEYQEETQRNADDDAPLSPPMFADMPNRCITNEDARRTSHAISPRNRSRYLPNIHVANLQHKQKTFIKPGRLAHKIAGEAHDQSPRASSLRAKAGENAGERDVYDLPCSSDTG